jgi:hypothetical protein
MEGTRQNIPFSADSKQKFIVVAPTFYVSTEEPRYLLGLDACREAVKYGINLILIDGSPSQSIKDGLEQAGTSIDDRRVKYVRVVRQKSKGKKGAALREGVAEALNELGSSISGSVIGFQELEKVDLFRHWNSIVKHMENEGSDVCVPKRRDAEFQSSYPMEQYHSETFANALLNSLGSAIKLDAIDWTNGPVALRATQARHWLQYAGELWDAQLVPIVDAHLNGAKVTSFEIDYLHPESMKNMEQGIAVWNEKRLYQINVLSDTVGKRIKDALQNIQSR